MSFFTNKPFSKWLYTKSNIQWVLQQLFKIKPSAKLRQQLFEQLKNSGFKREFVPIDEVKDISFHDFKKNYYLKNKPVILKGAALDWPCMQWNFDYLKENCAEYDTINTNIGDIDVISLGETIDLIRQNKSHKARFSTLLTHNKELLKETNLHTLKPFLPKLAFRTSDQFFIGTKGNFTPLHAGGTINFQAQVSGEKIWQIIDPIFNPVVSPIVDGEPLFKSRLNTDNPDFENFPEMKYIPILTAHLQPGDILYSPTFYWHQVKYLNESIAVGLRSLSIFSALKSSVTMLAVMATATNPPAIVSLFNINRGKPTAFYK